MIELLLGVQLELAGDIHVLRSLEHLRIDDVGDDRLVLARQVLVEKVDELCTRQRLRFRWCRLAVSHEILQMQAKLIALYYAATKSADRHYAARNYRKSISPVHKQPAGKSEAAAVEWTPEFSPIHWFPETRSRQASTV